MSAEEYMATTLTRIQNIQALSGWDLDANADIGPTPPSTYKISQQVPTNYVPPVLPAPPPNSLVLDTIGIAGKYCDWMLKKSFAWPKGANNIQLMTMIILKSGALKAVQAVEMGNRPTSWTGYTGNGQMQFVPIGNGLMRVDVVPSAAGGWVPTGYVLPIFTEGVVHTVLQNYIYDPNTESFWLLSFSVDGQIYYVRPNLQNAAMVAIGWQPGETVVGYQPDDNLTGLEQQWEIVYAELVFW